MADGFQASFLYGRFPILFFILESKDREQITGLFPDYEILELMLDQPSVSQPSNGICSPKMVLFLRHRQHCSYLVNLQMAMKSILQGMSKIGSLAMKDFLTSDPAIHKLQNYTIAGERKRKYRPVFWLHLRSTHVQFRMH